MISAAAIFIVLSSEYTINCNQIDHMRPEGAGTYIYLGESGIGTEKSIEEIVKMCKAEERE